MIHELEFHKLKFSMIGWKMINYFDEKDIIRSVVCKLEIPKDSTIIYGYTPATCDGSKLKQYRSDKAKVLGFYELDGTKSEKKEINHIVTSVSVNVTYTVDEFIKPDSYDDNRWENCNHGIHFFLDKEEAKEYSEYLLDLLNIED